MNDNWRNTVQYDIAYSPVVIEAVHTPVSQSLSRSLKLQKIPHISPSRASQGASIVRIWGQYGQYYNVGALY